MKDILLNEDLDLDLQTNDLGIGYSDLQHQELLLINNRGNIKEFPAIGIDAFGYLQDNNPSALLREVRKQFIADGMQVKTMDITGNGQLNIDAAMETVNVKPHQCLLDLSMQLKGGIGALFDFAMVNGISITDNLVPGSTLWAPDTAIIDRRTFQILRDEQVIPANAFTVEDEVLFKDGLGYIGIQMDLRIS